MPRYAKCWLALTLICLASSRLAAAASAPGAAVQARPLPPEQIALRAQASVVVVKCNRGDENTGLGSGFLADSSGLIATNAHVVLACDDVLVSLGEGTIARSAEIVLLDIDHDIAILRCPVLAGRPLAFRATDQLMVGQHVYAIGHPEGLEYTVSDGLISAVRVMHSGQKLLQTTAPISPGSSGGPLLDSRGRVIGMTTSYLSEGQNLNFAVIGDDIVKGLQVARTRVGHARDAGDSIQVANQLAPGTTPEALATLAHSYVNLRRYSIAKILLEQGLKRFPDDKHLLLRTAEVAWLEGRTEDAMSLVQKLLSAFPDFAPAHQVHAFLLTKLGRLGEARNEAGRTLELNPTDEFAAEAHLNLALILNQLHEPGEALQHIDMALKYAEVSQNCSVLALRACLLKANNQSQEAQRAARDILQTSKCVEEAQATLKNCGLPLGAVVLSYDSSWDLIGNLIVKGVVRNEGDETLNFVKIQVECLDEQGVIVGSGYGFVDPSQLFEPGMTGSFTIYVEGNPAKAKSYRVRVIDVAAGR